MKHLSILIVLLGLVIVNITVEAHSGRTDKAGCHTDTKTGIRHCH